MFRLRLNIFNKNSTSDVLHFSTHHIIVQICLITSDVNFDYFAAMAFEGVLHCKETFSLYKYLVGRYFETMQISCSHTVLAH